MSICMVNYGGSGDVSHDGVSGDQTVVSVPLGATGNDLVSTGGIVCESQNSDWIGEVDETSSPDEIFLTFRPDGTYTVNAGELICFNIKSLSINSETGLSVLDIDQQMGGGVFLPVNTAMSVFKMTANMASSVEIDPTVEESVKDGVSFDELSGNATDAQIPDTITVNQATNADTVDGVHAADLDESAEIDADIATHAGNAAAHHSKTTSFTELTDTATDAQIPDDITVNQATDADTVDGVHAAALEESAEIDADIATHAGNAAAHHAKTTSFTELTDTATDAQIPDDITVSEAKGIRVLTDAPLAASPGEMYFSLSDKKVHIWDGSQWNELYSSDENGTPDPPPQPPTQTGKVVFVTSTRHTGNLGGLTGADAICNGLANDAGLSGYFKAWLSDSWTSMNQRSVQSDGPYTTVTGVVVAENWEDLTDGDLHAPINIDETGRSVVSAASWNVWTNTNPDGS
ncbi:hypothetical protein VU04_01995 [Desulfobulbus sp. TB]|nr:hypothetical protein [Desulfobulbus sp. TB]